MLSIKKRKFPTFARMDDNEEVPNFNFAQAGVPQLEVVNNAIVEFFFNCGISFNVI